MQIVFLGTPEFAVPTLNALIVREDIVVQAVITQPDRESGRGQKLHAPPVKVLAQKHSISVFQPEKLRKAQDVVDELKKMAPDLMVMVAYGQILKPEVLAIPKLGIVNLHASLLPAYRGAAPINWSIINGDTISGVTTMLVNAGLDTGDILLKEEIAIDINATAEELAKDMAVRGAKLIVETIEKLKNGSAKPIAQDDNLATYAPMLDKSMAQIDWSKPALSIHNLVRGIRPWPVARTTFRNADLKIWRTAMPKENSINVKSNSSAQPGSIIFFDSQILIACGQNTWLELKEVQPANKAIISSHDWRNGIHLQSGEKLGQ